MLHTEAVQQHTGPVARNLDMVQEDMVREELAARCRLLAGIRCSLEPEALGGLCCQIPF